MINSRVINQDVHSILYAATVCSQDTHFPEKENTRSPSLNLGAILIDSRGPKREYHTIKDSIDS